MSPRPSAEGPVEERAAQAGRAGEGRRAGRGRARALEDELAEPAAWATKYESAKSTARHTAAKRAVEAAYAALAEHEERAFTE